MGYFAKVENNLVVDTITADHDFIASGVIGDPSAWFEFGSNSLAPSRRKAGIGYSFNYELDAFISPKPYESWMLKANGWQWEAPVPYPVDGSPYTYEFPNPTPFSGKDYVWNENTLEWDIAIIPQPYPSWVLMENGYQWQSPVPYPDDGKDYTWNEETVGWDEVIPPAP